MVNDKTTATAGASIKATVVGDQPIVVVKRPPATPIPTKPSGAFKSVFKFTSDNKVKVS